MKIALIGATGFIGSALREELLARGHSVTAIVSRPGKLSATTRLEPAVVDVLDTDALAHRLQGHDAVMSAFSGHAQQDVLGYYERGIRSIVAAARKARAPRLLVVGGAGSLEIAPGQQLIDTPTFPAQYRASAEGARQALKLLREERELEWTMLSPSALIAPGERTGKFRLGGDELLVDAKGESRISVQDFAAAFVDELEKPAHSRRRFTVGY
jgi:hypothetical protein